MGTGSFRGTIGKTYRDSRPWLEPVVRPPQGAPNVLVIVLDDVGFAQLGCYGSNIETPRIDALAARGRRYNNFHTTAMCSPTRASLLTGRNHHAVGMGMIADWCTGYPGYQGQVSKRAATLAEMLRPSGYSCFAIGKWHLTRVREMAAGGPYDQWPLGRGFERYYGFLFSLMDHWNPELVCDNHAIPTPRRPGYHLTEDLVDQTIGMIRDQQAAAPGKPFFAYLALGACHSPHQAPRREHRQVPGSLRRGLGRDAPALVRAPARARHRAAGNAPHAAQPRRQAMGLHDCRRAATLRAAPGSLRRVPRPHRRADRPARRLPRVARADRQHADHRALGQRRNRRGWRFRRQSTSGGTIRCWRRLSRKSWPRSTGWDRSSSGTTIHAAGDTPATRRSSGSRCTRMAAASAIH